MSEEMHEEGEVKRFMYVNRKAPYGTIYALESLEVVRPTATPKARALMSAVLAEVTETAPPAVPVRWSAPRRRG